MGVATTLPELSEWTLHSWVKVDQTGMPLPPK